MSVELLRALPNDTDKLKYIFTKFGHVMYNFNKDDILKDAIYLILHGNYTRLLGINRIERIPVTAYTTFNFNSTSTSPFLYSTDVKESIIYNYKSEDGVYSFDRQGLDGINLKNTIVYICRASVLKHILFSFTVFSIKANIEMILKKE